ncbi:hypothetical protein M426DRAFT_62016 [Hypoxylon sp. CI-4A]|nr:hypothetical protein M426DRAFT_62016 [Hypoxylon sp. CI-4A]
MDSAYNSFPKFEETWKGSLKERAATLRDEFPDYHLYKPESLVSASYVRSFQLGTGASIYTQSLIPAIVKAKHEVILVTCFWAPSATLSALKEALEKLAEDRRKRILTSGSENTLSPLRIRICFSSRSLFQKLFHTSSKDGYVYPPSTWPTQLGLPSQETLEAGLIDLRVKSLFFLPFSVMHPKFLIIDRQTAWIPSCNVSWEAWLEGCVEITGNAVDNLVKFYRNVWDRNLERHVAPELDAADPLDLGALASVPSSANLLECFSPELLAQTILLPSSHHRNPQFDFLPWRTSPSPPATPLNHAILRLLDMAEHTVYMQTPNLTSAAVIDGIIEALKRGVNVTIVTSKRLMILEQLVTAGTTTWLCVRSLIRNYTRLQAQASESQGRLDIDNSEQPIDIEAQRPRLGTLSIDYFCPHPEYPVGDVENSAAEEPVQSHIKLTIVDGQYVVLGSGNMDRASWFTSQELGILFHSRELASTVGAAVSQVLSRRREPVFSSATDNQSEQHFN